MGICALYVFLWVVKRFEIPKALYKFPIIIIIIKTSFAREVSLLVTEFEHLAICTGSLTQG